MREASLLSTRDAVRKRREKLPTGNEEPLEQEQLEMVMELLQEIDATDVLPNWPRLIEQKATAITMEASDLHRNCEALKRRIVGYKKHLGGRHHVETAMDETEDQLFRS